MNVLEKYIKNNIIVQIPRKNKDRIVLFNYISEIFENNMDYSEQDVNNILKKNYEDYAILRRYLVDFGFLKRNVEGTIYRKNSDK